MELPEGRFSPRLKEITQILGVEQAFGQASKTLEAIFDQTISVHSLERINQKLTPAAEEFLFELPTCLPAGRSPVPRRRARFSSSAGMVKGCRPACRQAGGSRIGESTAGI